MSSLKKRVNDLSILKSSNNAILNQKLTQLQEENNKLKKQFGEKRPPEEKKPYLFGLENDDC